jgi:hypothetical protein
MPRIQAESRGLLTNRRAIQRDRGTVRSGREQVHDRIIF